MKPLHLQKMGDSEGILVYFVHVHRIQLRLPQQRPQVQMIQQ